MLGFILREQKLEDIDGVDQAQIKEVAELIDEESLFSPVYYDLLCWAAKYYHENIGQVLDTALPQVLRSGKPAKMLWTTKWQLTSQGEQTDPSKIGSEHQRKIIEMLQEPAPITRREVSQQTKAESKAPHKKESRKELSADVLRALKLPNASLKSLESKGLIRAKEQLRISTPKFSGIPYTKPKLNEKQEDAVRQVAEHFGKFRCFLLEGLTNSGKTEVYIEIIRKVLQRDEQVLYLVPEIGLSPQSLERLEKSLAIPLSVFHSGMTANDRMHNYMMMKQNILKLMVGTRSASFVQLAKPGCIIIDEEHDSSYKQASGFRYNAKHLLIKLANELGIPIILGSATPSLESLHNAISGKYQHLKLQQRIKQTTLPKLSLVEIRKLPSGIVNEGIAAIRDTLDAGGQVLVFINRRGFAPILRCEECGWEAVCSSCDRHLTLHKNPPSLQCHLCETSHRVPDECPKCTCTKFTSRGIATQRIEEILRQKFPKEKIYRIDRDTMRGKNSQDTLYKQAKSTEPCILVGTQMLAKGHDFSNLQLGLMLNVDAGLLSNDFHTTEQVAQLIVQVRGRIGRDPANYPKESRIIVPSFNPDNPILQVLLQKGYASFAMNELKMRQSYRLPPYHYLAYLRAEAPSADEARDFLTAIKQGLLSSDGSQADLMILGAIESSLARKNNLYRFALIIKSSARGKLHKALSRTCILADGLQQENKLYKKLRWSLDIDPLDSP